MLTRTLRNKKKSSSSFLLFCSHASKLVKSLRRLQIQIQLWQTGSYRLPLIFWGKFNWLGPYCPPIAKSFSKPCETRMRFRSNMALTGKAQIQAQQCKQTCSARQRWSNETTYSPIASASYEGHRMVAWQHGLAVLSPLSLWTWNWIHGVKVHVFHIWEALACLKNGSSI